MKLKKTLIRLASVLVLVAILAGCTNEAATTPAGDGGAAGEVTEVTIGLLAPLTGGVAQFGTAVQHGVMLYVDAHNALGGVQINVIPFDEEGDPTLALTGYLHLYDQGVSAIIGSVTSGSTLAVVPDAYADGMPMITATSTAAAVTVDAATGHVWSNMFRSCFIDPFQGEKMAEFAVEVLGAQTAAVLFSNEIDYSIGLAEAFIARAEHLGLEIVAVETFAEDAISYHSQLTNIANVNPDVMFFPAYYQHVALMGPQSVEVGLEATLLGADGWEGSLEIMADPSSIEGAFFLTGFTDESDDPMVQEFIANFTAAVGSSPNMFGAQAYDAAMILINAIEGAIAEGYHPTEVDGFRASIIRHMAATDLTGVTGHITFDEFNNPQKTAFIIQVVDGSASFWGYF